MYLRALLNLLKAFIRLLSKQSGDVSCTIVRNRSFQKVIAMLQVKFEGFVEQASGQGFIDNEQSEVHVSGGDGEEIADA